MPRYPRKHVKIPSHWHPREALAVVGFLEQILDAIWRQHGPAMADFLYEPQRAAHDRHTARLLPRRSPRRPPALARIVATDDDIPF